MLTTEVIYEADHDSDHEFVFKYSLQTLSESYSVYLIDEDIDEEDDFVGGLQVNGSAISDGTNSFTATSEALELRFETH